MKNRIKFFAMIIGMIVVLSINAQQSGKNVIIKIDNVRGDKGSVLVMATIPGVKEPIYSMEKAKEGEVSIILKGVNADTAEISIFHDENGNYKIDMGERGPTEGYVTKKIKIKEADSTVIKVTLFYPN